MDNEALGKRKICFWRDRKARRFLLSKNLEKCLPEKKNFKSRKRRFCGKLFKNEFLLSAVSVGFLSSQNFKDKMEARMRIGKENLA